MVPSVPWQNGRILFLDDTSRWILGFYSLKSILPRGAAIWQNGRILFEMSCQTSTYFWIYFKIPENWYAFGVRLLGVC
jgi:hypothetical protein